MYNLEARAQLKIRKGKLDGFKRQAAEIIRLTKEKDSKTLRYDWFLNKEQTECQVIEAYESSEGLIEHNMHVFEARDKLFNEFAYDHTMTIYGDPSPELVELSNGMKGLKVKWYSFVKGLES